MLSAIIKDVGRNTHRDTKDVCRKHRFLLSLESAYSGLLFVVNPDYGLDFPGLSLVPTRYARFYTHMSLRYRHPGRDCRDPEAMDGNTETTCKYYHMGLLGKFKRSHPCALDSGNPCRNDVLLKICIKRRARRVGTR
jgi:hypothetical protein